MQFAEWLRRNGLIANVVADMFGMERSNLSRMIVGDRPATFEIIIRSFEISKGEVTHLDWIKTGRARLIERGVIKADEEFSDGKPEEWPKYVDEPVEQQEKRGRGRPKGSADGKPRRLRTAQERARPTEGEQQRAAARPQGRSRNRRGVELDSD